MKQSKSALGVRGFSLIEVLIAVVVLSLGLLALASLQVSLIRAGADSKAQTLALAVAKQKLDLLQSAESFGGTDNSCVSPSVWVSGQVSCYRAITDEAMPGTTNVDGDPTVTGTQPMGGIEFRMGTEVTRYVFNKTTGQYDSGVGDTALSTAVNTSTYLPGKEFKRIVVSVAWTDAANSVQTISLEDAIPGVVPRDSIALLLGKKGVLPRKAEAIIVNPGSVAGVIPIAVGNGSNTAASNPTPVLIGQQNNQYAETRFDVYTYIPLNETTALAQARVETTVAPCTCSTANASTSETPMRPTYWNGLRYTIPFEANYVGLTASAPNANRPLAGPKSGVTQSEQCRVCCRDHFDPSGNDANGDPRAAVAKFSPRRATHSHYLVTSATLGSPVTSGDYSEVCRLVRVDGVFRVAADFNNDYFALIDARNTGISPFVPSNEVSSDYSDMVKKYLSDRYSVNAATSATYNNATSPNPYSTTYTQGTRAVGLTTRSYDLDSPALAYLKLSGDARWLHARGLYVDYLEPEAIAKIDAVKASCTATDPNECVLPYLPFTSINLSELAEWVDVPVNPASTASKAVVDVMNRGFDTALGDTTYTRSTGTSTSTSGSYTINFQNDVGAQIIAGMSVSGTGVGNNARVTAVANNGRSLTVDVPNSAAIAASTTLTFQGAPVRGRAMPGTSVASGNQADARATASYNNAAIALRFPMNPDETALTDSQRFEFSVGGTPPDPTAGTFYVSGFSIDGGTALQPDGVGPKVYWGVGSNSPSATANCDLTGNAYPFVCAPTSGLGGPPQNGMTIRVENYNRYVKAADSSLTYSNTINVSSCLYKNGSTVGSGTLDTGQSATVTGVKQPYVDNFSVSSVTLAGSSVSIASPLNSPTTSLQNLNETTEVRINPVLQNPTQTITLGLTRESPVRADYLCCIATKNGNKYKFDRAEFQTPTVHACTFTP